MLLTTSQQHWDVNRWIETRVDGIGCLCLRLESEVANSIYGTSCIPIISPRDLLTAKLIRNAHWLPYETPRAVHNLTRTTFANLKKGEVAIYLKGQQRDVKRIILECGVCHCFDERTCRPTLGRSLFRCRVGTPSFKHISTS